ncbi:hypothetical protein AA15669_0627 [Saccharibacter floricola DSM 15669]|uniref:Uncharacterized protein n=1 Tax=Saccharibacter floricola DSM 15669 TaxID=1123227 RepID=A0ABQ0NXD9_9PROT|nr:hypothetical protein AA15669_0627 [Saccharibacter floricola DSM 15669]
MIKSVNRGVASCGCVVDGTTIYASNERTIHGVTAIDGSTCCGYNGTGRFIIKATSATDKNRISTAYSEESSGSKGNTAVKASKFGVSMVPKTHKFYLLAKKRENKGYSPVDAGWGGGWADCC